MGSAGLGAEASRNSLLVLVPILVLGEQSLAPRHSEDEDEDEDEAASRRGVCLEFTPFLPMAFGPRRCNRPIQPAFPHRPRRSEVIPFCQPFLLYGNAGSGYAFQGSPFQQTGSVTFHGLSLSLVTPGSACAPQPQI